MTHVGGGPQRTSATKPFEDHAGLSHRVQAEEFQHLLWKAGSAAKAVTVATFTFVVMPCLLCQNCDFLWPPFIKFVMFRSFKGSKGMVYLNSRKRNILNPASCERYIEGRLFTLPRDSHWGALSNKYCMRHLACDLVQIFRTKVYWQNAVLLTAFWCFFR